MTTQSQKIALAKEMLDSAEKSIHSAKIILSEFAGETGKANIAKNAISIPSSEEAEGKIVEGVFEGQHMIGSDGRTYPVPANYSSKSKMIPGDALKLTILDDGRFLYKQIGPVERKTLIGTITFEDGKYRVIVSGRAYNVLTASVTYYKAEPGDDVTVVVPALEESEWAAIDNLVEKPISGDNFPANSAIDEQVNIMVDNGADEIPASKRKAKKSEDKVVLEEKIETGELETSYEIEEE